MKLSHILNENKMINEANIQTIISIIKDDVPTQGRGRREEFDQVKLNQTLSSVTKVHGASEDTLVSVLKSNGLNDKQVEQVKPHLLRAIKKAEAEQAQSDEIVSDFRKSQKNRRGVINKRDLPVGARARA